MPRHLLLLSNSTLHPTGYLEYAEKHIVDFLKKHNVKSILFIPYALRDHDGYASKAGERFKSWGFGFESAHSAAGGAKAAVARAEAFFVGGGNTFQLLKALYDHDLVEAIRGRVLTDGVPYIGSSAGTNVATASISTTNDMPIVWPPSLAALALVPFNINPHFLDSDPDSTHKGETREERIRQYQEIPGVPPVLALREGSILHVEGNAADLVGDKHALVFRGNTDPVEYKPNTDFAFLLKE